MQKNNKILIVEDSKPMAVTLANYIEAEFHIVLFAENGEDALQKIDAENPDALLLDLNLPDMHGFDILKYIEKKNLKCAVIVITGEAGVNNAVEAMKLGAYDFVPKPVSPERLNVSLSNALENRELQKIATTYKKISKDGFCNFVGCSPEMQAVYAMIENAARSSASVFITGESGTGKELAAEAVHSLSARSNKPLEILNCAAIPHNLLESEIFGHVKGAFTGAVSNHIGAAERADGGTIFLDELGEMPMELQSKLLRFIQTKKFKPVGGTKLLHVDLRFVCATNCKPLEAIDQGRLREDLYYRLNVIPVHLLPLRDRGNDIELLAQYFLAESVEEEGKNFKSFSDAVKKIFVEHSWPGNVRELENTIRRAVVLHDGDVVEARMFDILEGHKKSALEHGELSHSSFVPDGFLPENQEDVRSLVLYERDVIQAALKACNNNITETAKRLDINPATIHRKQKLW